MSVGDSGNRFSASSSWLSVQEFLVQSFGGPQPKTMWSHNGMSGPNVPPTRHGTPVGDVKKASPSQLATNPKSKCLTVALAKLKCPLMMPHTFLMWPWLAETAALVAPLTAQSEL